MRAFVRIFRLSVCLLGIWAIPVVAQADLPGSHPGDDEVNDSDEDSAIQSWGQRELQYLKESIPDLHRLVVSPDWKTMDGMEKLRLVVMSTLKAWEIDDDEIKSIMDKITDYKSELTTRSRLDREMYFGLVGERLLEQFIWSERSADITISTGDPVSQFAESNIQEIFELRVCMTQSSSDLGSKTQKTLKGWIESLNEESPSSMTPDILFDRYKRLATEFDDAVIDVIKDWNVCLAATG